MAVSKFSVCVLGMLLLLVCGVYQNAEALKITVKFTVHPFSSVRGNPFKTTSDRVSSSLLEPGIPLFLLGAVGSEEVAAVCQQIVSTGNRTLTLTVVDGRSGLQEDLTIQIESFKGCESSTEGMQTEAVLVDDGGQRSTILCSKSGGSESCSLYRTGNAISQLRGSRGRILRHSCNGVLVCLCFPGDARVQMADGEEKQMHELNLGDEVAVRSHDGGIAYESVYAFGHKDAMAVTEFTKITIVPTKMLNESSQRHLRSLELSARHFVPVFSGTSGRKIVQKRAQEVKVGDTMLASTKGINDDEESLGTYSVTEISKTMKTGLYNPFTMGGSIVVNGVVASVHSDWFLDVMFDSLGLTHLLPAFYQVILAPPRMLYKVLGKQAYIATYTWLDVHVDVESLVRDYSATATTISVVSVIIAPFGLFFFSIKKR